MGANLAGEVADEKFCETTIGKVNSLIKVLIFLILSQRVSLKMKNSALFHINCFFKL